MNVLPSLLLTAFAVLLPATCVCSPVPASNDLCTQLRDFAALATIDTPRVISLSLTPSLSAKQCTRSPRDAKGAEFCMFLLSRTSSENLAPHISNVVKCLTGSALPVGKNIRTKKLAGTFEVYSAFDLEDIEIEFDYRTGGDGADTYTMNVTRQKADEH